MENEREKIALRKKNQQQRNCKKNEAKAATTRKKEMMSKRFAEFEIYTVNFGGYLIVRAKRNPIADLLLMHLYVKRVCAGLNALSLSLFVSPIIIVVELHSICFFSVPSFSKCV